MPLSIDAIADIVNLQRAVRFVRHDKDDEPIHDPLNDVAFLDALDRRLPDISTRLRNRTYEPRRITIVEVPKGTYTTRPVAQLEFEDWIVAQAVLNVVGDQLDQLIPKERFAFRVNPKRNMSNRHK